MNFLDNHAGEADDGGTIIVPYFHKHLPVFCRRHKALRKPLPWLKFPPEVPEWADLERQLLHHAHRYCIYVLNLIYTLYTAAALHLIYVLNPPYLYETHLLNPPYLYDTHLLNPINAHRVPMRAGSVLVWDQTVAHGTAPNNRCVCV
jgi:ectoine hydroxylase-related dioxygenase (phytanoyl-CoA dioxygenase family)